MCYDDNGVHGDDGDNGDDSDDEDILDRSLDNAGHSDTDSAGGAKDLAAKDVHVASNDYKSAQGHIENDDEIEGDFEGVEWGHLPPHVKEAAKILGYSRRLWDVGGTVIAEKKLWDHLTNKEKEAAKKLGYNKVSSGVAKKSASSCIVSLDDGPHPHLSRIYSIPLTSRKTWHFDGFHPPHSNSGTTKLML